MVWPTLSMNSHTTRYMPVSGFSSRAGLVGNFMTHCFRCGARAQYRFMLAPLGERWPLTIIRWWGGWAVGEHVVDHSKYIIHEFQLRQVDIQRTYRVRVQIPGPTVKYEASSRVVTRVHHRVYLLFGRAVGGCPSDFGLVFSPGQIDSVC